MEHIIMQGLSLYLIYFISDVRDTRSCYGTHHNAGPVSRVDHAAHGANPSLPHLERSHQHGRDFPTHQHVLYTATQSKPGGEMIHSIVVVSSPDLKLLIIIIVELFSLNPCFDVIVTLTAFLV